MSELRKFLQEAGRRHVARVAVVYGMVAFGFLEAADIIIPVLGWPVWTIRYVIALALLGFPVTLILAWVYDLTPKGVIRTKTLDEGEGGGRGITVRPAVPSFQPSSSSSAGRWWPWGPSLRSSGPRRMRTLPPALWGKRKL